MHPPTLLPMLTVELISPELVEDTGDIRAQASTLTSFMLVYAAYMRILTK
jgi:hypothetical protein